MIEPLADYILIEVDKVGDDVVTSSGIILPTEKGKKMEKGTALAFGKDVKSTEMKVGDTLLFKSYSYDTVEIDGKESSFIKEDQVLGKL